ncbi:hypothetical protein ACLB2K_035708 [Fragaria x ananassa]
MRWVPNFSPASHRNSNAQVWVRFWDLGLEFWETQTLFEIASGIGIPIKVDNYTLERRYGLFARILIDIDLTIDPPLDLVVERESGEALVLHVEYEKLPSLCTNCGNLGHVVSGCNSVKRSKENNVSEVERRG